MLYNYIPAFIKLIFMFIFKVVTPCIPFVGLPYFGLFIPFYYYHLPLYFPCPLLSRAVITHSSFLYLLMLWYAILLMVYHSLFCSLSLWVPYTCSTALHLTEYIVIIVFGYKFSLHSSSYETKDAHQCRNQDSLPKTHYLCTSLHG
jgi:hypothetical protein